MQNISESLRKQREIVLEESSEQALDRHTSLLEIAIISLYNRIANRLSNGLRNFEQVRQYRLSALSAGAC